MQLLATTVRSSVLLTVLAFAAGCASRPHGFVFDVAADVREFTAPQHAGTAYFGGVCAALQKLGRGAFMVSPGDVDPPERVRSTLDEAFGKNYAWYPVVGNHEG
jgi:hypothetical protein